MIVKDLCKTKRMFFVRALGLTAANSWRELSRVCGDLGCLQEQNTYSCGLSRRTTYSLCANAWQELSRACCTMFAKQNTYFCARLALRRHSASVKIAARFARVQGSDLIFRRLRFIPHKGLCVWCLRCLDMLVAGSCDLRL